MRFEQRRKVGLITLLSALVKASMTLSLVSQRNLAHFLCTRQAAVPVFRIASRSNAVNA